MVGAVVVKDGVVVGRGFHEVCGQAHAEVNAIDDAGDEAAGATIYVTLEPCNHTGKTPPCTQKILAAGIKKVVVAMDDPNPGVEGGGNNFLRSQGIDVKTGVLREESEKLNEIFTKYITTKSPFVVLKCAATLDGRIATRTGNSKWVTGPQSRAYVHELRHLLDGIMVGIDTIKADDPSLTTRREDGSKGKDPVRIILDSKLSIDENARVLKLESCSDTFVITGDQVSEDKKHIIESTGAKVLKAPMKSGRIDLGKLMPILGSHGITSLLIEGGSRVAASSLAAGIVDKINFFYAPKILGSDDGIPIARGEGPEKMDDAIQVKDMKLHIFGEDFMAEGYVR
jgi:diaminohydroxyphosphoribosylaminopyrimidine deaminase/5-amino-6-(5-phosphoribosylamino)uracil reductase